MALSSSRSFRYTLLFVLAMTEMMPVALLAQALPVLLRRNGASFQSIGLLSLVLMPRALKVLWAPLIDKLGSQSKFGRYRAWLLTTHPLLLLTLVLGAFTDIPALLSGSRMVGLVSLMWLMFISATADTASHGLAVNLLGTEERGVGNGVQTAGMMLGNLVGGGLLIVLVDHLGWRTALLTMAFFVMLPIPGILGYREPTLEGPRQVSLSEIFALFRRPRILHWLGLLALMTLGPTMVDVCLQTLLVDRGFALSEIGIAMGVIASLAGALGGTVGGLTIKYLGRERAFFVLTVLAAACLASVLITRKAESHVILYTGLAIPIFGVVARATLIYAMVMDRSRGHVASTDYTLQVSVVQVCGFAGLGLGGVVAEYLGVTAVFVIAPLLTLSVLLASGRLFQRSDFQVESHTS